MALNIQFDVTENRLPIRENDNERSRYQASEYGSFSERRCQSVPPKCDSSCGETRKQEALVDDPVDRLDVLRSKRRRQQARSPWFYPRCDSPWVYEQRVDPIARATPDLTQIREADHAREDLTKPQDGDEDVPCSGTEETPLLDKVSEPSELTKPNYCKLLLVNIIMVVWSIASYFHSPVLSQYLYRRISAQVFNGTLPDSGKQNYSCYDPDGSKRDSGSYSLQEEAQKLTTEFNLELTLVACSCEIVGTIMVGAYADYIGRKPLFIIPVVGELLKNALLTTIIHWNLDLRWYFIGEVVTGLSGGSKLFYIACYTFVADNTPRKGSRTVGLALIDTSVALTSAAMSVGVGYFIQDVGFMYPSLASASMGVLNIIAIVVLIPATKPRQIKGGRRCINPITGIKNVFGFYLFEGTSKTRLMFWLALVAFLLTKLGSSVGSVGTLWEMNYPFCWSSVMIGYYSTGSNIVKQLLAVPILKLFQFCLIDEIIALWSFLAGVGSNLFKAFSYNNWMMYGVALVGAVGIGATPIIRSSLSQMTSNSRQASMFAGLCLVEIVCSMGGTSMYSTIYMHTVDVMRGTTYLVVSGFETLALFIFLVFTILTLKGYKKDAIKSLEKEDSEQAITDTGDGS